jgi:hypothetical protein
MTTEKISLELAKLWCEYYIYVKKMRDIDFKCEFDELELHDINNTIFMFLNHLGEKGTSFDETKNSCDENIETNDNTVFNE